VAKHEANWKPVTDRSGRRAVAERPVGAEKPGNAGGAKGPWFKTDVESGEGQEIGKPINSE